MASLTPIKPGDIVEININGRRGYGLVLDKDKPAHEQGRLKIRPITHGFTWREVTATQVVAHWRRSRTRPKNGGSNGT